MKAKEALPNLGKMIGSKGSVESQTRPLIGELLELLPWAGWGTDRKCFFMGSFPGIQQSALNVYKQGE